LNLFFNLKNFI